MNEAALKRLLSRVKPLEGECIEESQGADAHSPEVQESNTIQGVKIYSHILGDEIWLILDPAFVPVDGLACYYAEEIPLLRDKTPEELREIHKTKLAFPGARVIQEGKG